MWLSESIFVDDFVQMTRLITGILAIYITLLAVMSCVDNCSLEFCQTEGIEHLEQRHNKEHKDSCSPLCNCLCCNTVVSVAKSYSMQISIHSADVQPAISSDLSPFILKPTSPPPKA